MLLRILELLFGRSRDRASKHSRRALNLPLEPTVTNAPALAARIVQVTSSLDGVQRDYSADSLKWVDARILQFRRDGENFDSVGETIFLFGCYAGEVLVRTLGGSWAEPDDTERSVGFSMPGVRFAGGQFWNPIGKSIRLLETGPTESLYQLWLAARCGSSTSAA